MSRFNEIMSSAGMPAFRRIFGDEATYTPVSGSPITTWAILSKSSEYAGEYDDRLERRITAKLPASDVSAPKPGDTLEIDGVTYRVGQTLSIGMYFVEVLLRVITSLVDFLFTDDGATYLTADDGATVLTLD